MHRRLRSMREIAKREGLTVVDVVRLRRHTFVIVRNGQGVEYRQPVNLGGGGLLQREQRNVTANFRRLARGELSGLHTIRRSDN